MYSRFLWKSVLVSKNISLLRGEFFWDNCWSYWVKQQQLGQPAAASQQLRSTTLVLFLHINNNSIATHTCNRKICDMCKRYVHEILYLHCFERHEAANLRFYQSMFILRMIYECTYCIRPGWPMYSSSHYSPPYGQLCLCVDVIICVIKKLYLDHTELGTGGRLALWGI